MSVEIYRREVVWFELIKIINLRERERGRERERETKRENV